ncbi:hypothetical protein K435DRAFT_847282 [Dendrothele bispora CBS 962.96]|uniref:Oxidoreductase-like domain-containing protein n=1 Tax=Dendrothele bispora (strain CBS 962.96) TaxID=1314807 RepID=A0A4S8MY89_DENBC|nr:hypothetical protein K435DRAFT_847282 [Dendrothele bispora CBS 962.96]
MLTEEECLERSSFLANLQRKGRLTPSRLQELFAALMYSWIMQAKSPKPPKEPDPWDCCGSNCKPCVNELWRQELRCWQECHPDGVEEDVEDMIDGDK